MKTNKLLRIATIAVLLQSMAGTCFAQLVINEICPKNTTIIKDEDGDFEDWIEIYNSGSTAVNLSSYYLSDDFSNLSKWQLPAYSLQPQQYFLVFASDKNRKLIINHWETAVSATDQWRYKKPISTLPPNWNTVSFNDASWSQGPGGFGFGDGDDGTVISQPAYSVFIRKTFTITDTSKIVAAILTADIDDAFVAYLNGVEIARDNIGVSGVPPAYDELAFKEQEAKLYQGQEPANFKINMDLLKSVMVNGTNVLALQVHNKTYYSSDLSAIAYLHFGLKDAATYFPAPPAWFDAALSSLHTNFKLTGDGESVYLSNASQTVVSQITYPYLQMDHSYGSFPDGSTFTAYFSVPTPDSSNSNSTAMNGYTANPVFSVNSGFYSSAQTVSLSCSTPSSTIRYTKDGSVPTTNSFLYSSPLSIDSTKVIRARAFSSSGLPSDIIANTYFINDSSTIPVFSLIANPDDLFDWNSGIYVMGPNADTARPFFGANFWQQWEIRAHIEFFDKQKQLCLEQGIGLEIQGNYSRGFPQKSFKLVARGSLGKGSLDYPFFPERELSSYEQVILRNAGNDWNDLHMRDAVFHKICQDKTLLDVQHYQPCLVYINGKYWGVYNIREKINKDYLAATRNANPDSIDMLEYNGLVREGNFEDFGQFSNFVMLNNFTDSANYQTLKNWLDIDNFIDYFVVETYSENGDWLLNNVRYWRERKAGAKWRHVLWDLDFFATNWYPFTANSLDTNLNKAFSFHSVMFNKLWQNIEFRHKFINRYADLLNTIFTPFNTKRILNTLRDSVAAEMPRHYQRWGKDFYDPTLGAPGKGTIALWNGNNMTNKIIPFLNYRQQTARNQIEQVAGLKQQVPLTFNVYPPGAGKIELNTIKLDSFPWAGIYFDSVPISFKAIPNPGYEFAFWQSNNLIKNPHFNAGVNLNTDTTDVFTAYFFGSPDTVRICINEINYKSSASNDAGDWIELYNYGTVDVDLSGWKFKDEVISNSFIFPANTILEKNKFLVLCRDSVKFKASHPGISNFTGDFGFGLNASGSNLRLFDADGKLYTSMTYGTASPWPTEPNGTGKTLERLDESGNSDNPYNWFAGCLGGSPGTAFVPCALGEELKIPPSKESLQLKNYPNPFNNSTTISFNLHQDEAVQLTVIDVYGKKVFTLIDKELPAGTHKIDFTPEKFSSGIYFYRVSTAHTSETRMMSLIK